MTRRLGVVLTAVLVAALTGCGLSAHVSKNTLIDRSRSIGPIAVGETRAKIEAAYGKGQRAFLPGRPHNTPITFYPAVSIGVLYYESNAIWVETTAAQYRTKSGMSVGSTAAQLRKSGAECQQDQCWLANSNLSTNFFMSSSYPSHRDTRAIRVVVGPVGN